MNPIPPTRIKRLNNNAITVSGLYVLYWMQSSHRCEFNHALEYAILEANKLNLPLIILFTLADNYPEANLRHYHFMLEGLKEVEKALTEKQIQFLIRIGDPPFIVKDLAVNAALIVVDRGYLKVEREWRDKTAKLIKCPLIQVETNVIVPVEEASVKEEYSAATFRPKIFKKLPYYLTPLIHQSVKNQSLQLDFESLNLKDVNLILKNLKISTDVKYSKYFRGGLSEAKHLLKMFIKNKLDDYENLRNDPSSNCLSNMSPYLHFGQISPLYIALEVINSGRRSVDRYLEELIVRRELAINFVYYNSYYNSINSIPRWAIESLEKHKKDLRIYVYSLEEFENAQTHDQLWNTCQLEMVKKGKMHGYMRMYWCKKIIEWSRTPEEAYKIAVYLNNKYELDGRDPNSYAGIAWCFGKHDRPWFERPVLGKIRYMSLTDKKRNGFFNQYIETVNSLD